MLSIAHHNYSYSSLEVLTLSVHSLSFCQRFLQQQSHHLTALLSTPHCLPDKAYFPDNDIELSSVNIQLSTCFKPQPNQNLCSFFLMCHNAHISTLILLKSFFYLTDSLHNAHPSNNLLILSNYVCILCTYLLCKTYVYRDKNQEINA